MGYIRAEDVLPSELLTMVQKYVDGKMLYVPKKSSKRNKWGSLSGARKTLECRNNQIYEDYLAGSSIPFLAEKYFLSVKSIQKIIKDNKPSDAFKRDDVSGGCLNEP